MTTATLERPEAIDAATSEEVEATIEVELDGRPERYSGEAGVHRLAADIALGRATAASRARRLAPGADPDAWAALEQVARPTFVLDRLFRPVWAHSIRGLGYGILAGIALKTLESTVSMFVGAPDLAPLWVLFVGAMVASGRFPIAAAAACFFAFKAGLGGAFLGLAFGSAAAGAAFGAPAGLLVGTLVGLARRSSYGAAPGRRESGAQLFALGVVAPLAALAGLAFAYVAWLMPTVAALLEE